MTAILTGVLASELRPGDRVLLGRGLVIVTNVAELPRSHVFEPGRVAIHTTDAWHVVLAATHLAVERETC